MKNPSIVGSGEIPASAGSVEIYGSPLRLAVGSAEQAKYGQDTILQAPELGLFGVFDGMGSGDDPAHASSTAAQSIVEFYAMTELSASPDEATQQMKYAIEYARNKVIQHAGDNATTAAVVRLQTLEGKTALIWGNSGDSRIFIRSAAGHVDYDVCTDQSTGNILENGLGAKTSTWPRMEDEAGYRYLSSGDRIMICSDGITGDWEDEKILPDEFENVFSLVDTQAAAEEFIEISIKSDDKSVLVIGIV